MLYLEDGEFYLEFGFFDVEIIFLKNYVVGVIGELVIFEEEQWLYEFSEFIRFYLDIFKYFFLFIEYEIGFEFFEEFKIICFKVNKVYDFVWFVDK